MNRVYILIFAVILFLLGVFGWNYLKSQKIAQIDNFEECAKAGFPVMESYPARCVIPDGRSFTQEAQSTPIPSDWQTYTDPRYNYSISYPKYFEVQQNGEDSIMIIKKTDFIGYGPANFIYVSSVTKDAPIADGQVYNYNKAWFDTLNSIQIGESKSLADPGSNQDEWFTYTRLDDTKIAGINTKVFVNKKPWEFPNETTEYMYFVDTPKIMFLLGGYIGAKDETNYYISEEQFKQIITTFLPNI